MVSATDLSKGSQSETRCKKTPSPAPVRRATPVLIPNHGCLVRGGDGCILCVPATAPAKTRVPRPPCIKTTGYPRRHLFHMRYTVDFPENDVIAMAATF